MILKINEGDSLLYFTNKVF